MDINQLDFEYLRYPYPLDSLRHSPEYIKEGVGPQAKRRIFYEVTFDDYEKEQISNFHKELRQKKVVLPKGWTDQETLKFLYSSKFDLVKGVDKVQKCLEWRNNPVSHTLTKTVREFFESGAIYTYGRDRQFRPILIIDLGKMDLDKLKEEDFSAAMTIMMDILLAFTYMPGKVENNVVILDARNLSLTKLPIGILKNFANLANNCFPATLHKCYLVGLPFLIKMSWKVIESLINKETIEKTKNINEDELQILQETIPPSQLEKKFGGSLPDLTQYWPPSSTFKAPGSLNASMLNESIHTGRFATLQHSAVSSLNRLDYAENYASYQQKQIQPTGQAKTVTYERYTSSARIGQQGSFETFSPNPKSHRVSQGVSYTPTKQRDEELIKEILYSKVKPTPPRSSMRGSEFLGDNREQTKEIERQLRSQPPALGDDISYREEESTLLIDSDKLLPLNDPDIIYTIMKEDNYLKHKNVADEMERIPAEVDWKIKERKTIEAKLKREVDDAHHSPDRRSARPTSEQQFANTASPNHNDDEYDTRFVQWKPKKLKELPKPSEDEESDEDDTGFCGLCVTSRKKKKPQTQTVA